MNYCRAFKATTFTQMPTISDNLVMIPGEPRQLFLQMKRPVFLSRKIKKREEKDFLLNCDEKRDHGRLTGRKQVIPVLTLRPRLLFSFNGSTMFRCFSENVRELVSYPLEGAENISTHPLRKSSPSNRS